MIQYKTVPFGTRWHVVDLSRGVDKSASVANYPTATQARQHSDRLNAPIALAAQRDGMLAQARAKTPGVRITADAPADDADALHAEITALREFIDRPRPGLHTDTYDEATDPDGPSDDPTNV